MAKRYDVDAIAAAFEPITIVFRGREHALARSAAHLLRIQDVRATVAAANPGLEGVELGCALMDPVLRALAPDLGPELDERPLSAGEQLGLLRPISEVIGALGRFREAPGDGV